MRARLARMGTRTSSPGNPVLEPLFRAVRANHPKADLALLERAYVIAEKLHGTQMRKSGDPYITHPLAVTTILADIGMTEPTLVAALLHDTVEDTPYTLDQLRTEFGDEVAVLVDGVTKLDKVKYGDSAQAETIRKMIVAMSRDIRVLVIKLADRLHNMRTLRYVRQETQERVARETLEIYAPLAHRLGMNTLKWELEDLAFATLHPKIYDEIVRLVAERAPSRGQFLAQVIQPGRAGPQGRQGQGEGHRPPEALLLDLPEDDRRRPGVLRHLRPGRHPHPGRGGPRLLLRARRPALAVEPGPGPVQGLRRDAEVQHVPVAAHDRHRPAGQAGRAADPDLRDAPPRRVRRRRALEVQGGRPGRRRHRPGRRPGRHDLGPPAARLAERRRGPGRVPGVAAVRDQPPGGLRLHAARRRDRAAHRRHPGRLRVRRAHRGRPPHDRRPGQRSPGAARVDARQQRRGRGLHVQGAERRPVARLARLREVAARPLQDPPVVHQGAARGGDRAGQGADRQADAQGGPAPQAAAVPRVADARRGPLQAGRRLGALRLGRRGQPQRPGRRTPRDRPARRRRGGPGGPLRGRHHHRPPQELEGRSRAATPA